jgi:hypothetical protein
MIKGGSDTPAIHAPRKASAVPGRGTERAYVERKYSPREGARFVKNRNNRTRATIGNNKEGFSRRGACRTNLTLSPKPVPAEISIIRL